MNKDAPAQLETVLIVDTDDFNRATLTSLFESLDVTNILTANNCTQAMMLYSASSFNPDLLIIDAPAPEMDILELHNHFLDHQFQGQILLTNSKELNLYFQASDTARFGGLDFVAWLRRPTLLARSAKPTGAVFRRRTVKKAA